MIARSGAFLAEIGGTDGFMRFLRVLGFGRVNAWFVRDVGRIIALGDGPARGRNRAVVHLHTIGAHVRDRAVLVEPLREPHRVARRKAEFARRFLLQGRGRKRWRRVSRQRLGFDILNRETTAFDSGLGSHRVALVANGQPVDLVAFPADQPPEERRAVMLQISNNRPIFLGPERFDLALAIHDHPQRDRLNTPRRLCPRQLAPQHGRQRKPDKIVQRPSRTIGIDEVIIERTRRCHRFQHRCFGDRVEGHALDFLG